MPEERKERFVFLKKFLMIVGVIAIIFLFLIILVIFLLALYVINNKPLGIEINPFAINPFVQTQTDSNYDHPLLSADQEKTLQSLGVNLESLPASITPAQEQCAVEALGQDRVNQIKSGATPSLTDYLKAKSCF